MKRIKQFDPLRSFWTRISSLKTVFALAMCLVFAAVSIHGATCDTSFPCRAYARAESVFVGELVDVKPAVDGFHTTNTFRVKQVLKGNPAASQSVRFRKFDFVVPFIIGEDYFVYAERSDRSWSPNLTHPFDKTSCDYKYALEVSKNPERFLTGGYVYEGIYRRVNGARIEVILPNSLKKVDLSPRGRFRLVRNEPGVIRLRLTVPFVANALVTSGEIAFKFERTVINRTTFFEYEVEYQAGGCDFRDIRVIRD